MAKKTERTNPFYVLVVLVGIAFVVTASAYGMMSFLEIRRFAPDTPQTEESPLWNYLRQEGDTLLKWEIAILVAGTVGSLVWDSWLGQDDDETSTSQGDTPAK